MVGGQLLLVVVGGVLDAVVRVGTVWEDGAAEAVSGERELQPQQWVRVLAVVSEPEELICAGGMPDGAVDHHIIAFLFCPQRVSDEDDVTDYSKCSSMLQEN